ncbi:MAG TPA: glycerol-3-phosphate dehydrogenase/oxidase [Polyangia bacterium]
MSAARAEARRRLSQETFDLIVIGGGATGAGIARDAVLRKLKVALIERRDYGSGTSSRSSKLIHGGLRYLQQAQLKLVFEGTNERALLVHLAPHLVRPIPFLFPTYKGRFPTLTMMDAGLWLYDALAKFRTIRHKRYNAKAVYALEPGLQREKLSGGIVYYDATTDDARLTLENILDARDLGACVLNYARAVGLVTENGRAAGLEVEDVLAGGRFTVKGKVVVNASGPWSDQVLGEIGASPGRPRLRPTKGTHILVDSRRLPATHAVVMATVDKRVTFTIPWEHRTVIGTTDTDYDGDYDQVVATRADAEYLLATANHYFPCAELTRADVLATWSGLRPLIAADATKTGDVSREHELFVDQGGVITISGGKLTTYRRMARECVDTTIRELQHRGFAEDVLPCTTEDRPLPGAVGLGDGVTLDAITAEVAAAQDLDPAVARNLTFTYGVHAPRVAAICARDRGLAARIDPEMPYIWAQLVYAVETELAACVDDFLGRRVPLLLMARDQGLGVAPEVARRMGALLGWDDAQRARSLALYQEIVASSRRFREE